MNSPPPHESRDEKTLFFEALEIEDAAERRAFLDRACAGDTELRQNLEDLLRIEDAGRSDTLDPSSYRALREGQESFAEFLEGEESFLNNLGTEIRTFGDYDLLEELGRGAMGVVFRARQRSLNREVAIKILVGSALASETDKQRFHLEAEAAANLRHPHIVPLLESGQIEGHDYFTMPVLAGGTLGDLMGQGALSPREAVALLLKVADAVQAAHDRGILHRDLKPQNVLLDDELEPHVSDFGLACRLEQAGTLTLSGQIMGTPQYMAPEQAEGGTLPITTAADVHGLGAILYELLAGAPAFRADSILRTLQRVKEQTPRSPRTLRSGIDRDLETITMKCLEKAPSRRYHSIGALRDDLAAWLAHRPIAARPPGAAERFAKWVRRRPVHAALALTIGLVVLALGVGGPLVAVQQAGLRERAEVESQRADLLREQAEGASAVAETEAERNRQLVYFSQMNRLGLAVTEPGTYPVLQELLHEWIPEPSGERTRPDLRGWEWYLLAAFAEQSERTFVIGEAFEPPRLHPDRHLISIPVGNTVRLYSTDRPDPIATLEEAAGKVCSAEWSPEGTRLATASVDGSITLWNVDSGEIVKTSGDAHGRGTTRLDWSPDGSRLVSMGMDNRVRLWDAASLEPLGTIEASRNMPIRLGVSWSPSGTHLAYWQPRDFVILAADEPGQPHVRTPTRIGGPGALAWNPVADQVATGGDDRTVSIWEIRGGEVKLVKQLQGHVSPIQSLAWSPDGKRLASGSSGRELKIWDVGSGEVVDELPGQYASIYFLDWGANHTLVAGDGSGVVRIWILDRNRVPRILHDQTAPLITARMNPAGDLLACVGRNRWLSLIEPHTGEERLRISDRPGLGEELSWRPDGRQLAFRIQSRNAWILDPETGARVVLLADAPSPIVDFGWDPVSGELLAAHVNGHLRIWDPAGKEVLRTLELEPKFLPLECASWSPDGSHIAGSSKRGRLLLWPAGGGDPAMSRSPFAATELATTHGWHPGGTHLAVGSNQGITRIWNVETHTEEHVLKGHTGTIHQLCWHPDGTRLASASADRTIKIWDPMSGEVILTLRSHAAGVKSIQWSSDGNSLISAGADGTILSWDALRAYRRYRGAVQQKRD